MTAWTNGYQTVVDYTYGYYRELSPTFQRFCLLLNGIEPNTETLGTTAHCELGFGQGVSLTVHAASHIGTFYGTDFNPAHASHASELAAHSGIHQHFYDDSFEELLHRPDLPMFDSIGLHGIWSWISHENQHIVLQFIRKYLKPNGVLYISYNNLIGWSANMPIRELLYAHFSQSSQQGNPLTKVKNSLEFSEKLLQQNPLFARNNPNALTKVQELKNHNPNYLIHEYLNQDWQCFSFQQMNRLMTENKLTFACSLDLNQFFENINLSEEQRQFLNAIEEPILKEQCRDYFYNNTFRRDLFIRGKRTLTPAQTQQKLRQTAFIVLIAKSQMPTKISGLLGSFDLVTQIYEPIFEEFAQTNYQPLTLSQLEERLPDLNYNMLLNALTILCHLNIAVPCQTLTPQKPQLEACHRLNHYMLSQSQFHQHYQVLASPITGIGVGVNYFEQLFYRAYFIENLDTAEAISEFSQNELQKTGQFLLNSEGNTITDRAESLAFFLEKAKEFLTNEKPAIAEHLRLFG